jgi:hypothetical protein
MDLSPCLTPRSAPPPCTWWLGTPPARGSRLVPSTGTLPRLGDVVSAQLLAEVHEAGEGEVEVWR